MSTLTKICVVVLALLILVACPVFITQATVGPHYRDLYESKVAENAALAQQVQYERLALGVKTQECIDKDSALTQAKADHLTREGELQAANAALEIKYATVQDQLKVAGANAQVQLAIVQDLNTRYDKLSAEAVAAREKINGLMTGNNRLDILLQDARARLTSTNKISRVQQEKIVVLEEEIARLRDNPGTIAGGSNPGPAPELEGTVVGVRQGLISINIGSAKGVQKGMKLVVHRGGEFIGNLRIVEVGADNAAGILVDARSAAKQSDKVFNEQKEGV